MDTKSERLKPLKTPGSRIFKLCLTPDRLVALQGLELAASLELPLEGVLDEVSVDPTTGELLRGKRFTGNEKTQTMLDALLLQQLAISGEGMPGFVLRQQLRQLKVTCPVVPDLSGFTGLEVLDMAFSPEFHGDDLVPLGKLPKLTDLKMSARSQWNTQGRASLSSLRGLEAPNLEKFSAANLGLKDIVALAMCKKLKQVNLQGHHELSLIDALKASAPCLEYVDLSRCAAIASLKPLAQASKLHYLDISGLHQISDLTDLKKCLSLQTLDVTQCEGLSTLEGLPLLNWHPCVSGLAGHPKTLALPNMKSLRSLRGLPALAQDVTEFSLNRAISLCELTGIEASTGLKTLKLNQAPITELAALQALTQLEVLEITDCPELTDASALGSLARLRAITLKNCPKLQHLPATWASPVKTFNLLGCPALQPLKSIPAGMDTKYIEIADRRLLPRAKALKALKSDVGSVWKLLSSRDIANIQVGLELSLALEDKFDTLFEGVSVNKEGVLQRGKRFTGTGPAQPYLDIALFGLMRMAKPTSVIAKMGGKIRQLHLSLTDLAPPLEGLTALEVLELTVLEAHTPDLSSFGPMPRLHTLKISSVGWNSKGSLNSLQGLQAPQLKSVTLRKIGLKDISALQLAEGITKVDLEGNQELSNIAGLQASANTLLELSLRDCKKIQSLEPLRAASKLTGLDLQACEALSSLEPLANCHSLTQLSLENCRSLTSLKGLENKHLLIEQSYDKTYEFSLDGCSSLKSIGHFPELGPDLTLLSLNNTSALTQLDLPRELPTLRQLNMNNSGMLDLSGLSSLPGLERLDLDGCKALQNVEPLARLTQLKTLSLDKTAVVTLPCSWTAAVQTISLKACTQLTSLGKLPTTLTQLECDGSTALEKLDGWADCKVLDNASFRQCSALHNLGQAAPNLKRIDLSKCQALIQLKGLEGCLLLEHISVPFSLKDSSAIAHLSPLTVAIEIETEDQVVAPAFVKAINVLKPISLHVKGSQGWYSRSKFDMSLFNQFKNLHELSFVDYNIRCELVELLWLVPISTLQGLWFTPRGSMSYSIGSSVFDSPKKVRDLQLKICTAAKIKPPAHLTV